LLCTVGVLPQPVLGTASPGRPPLDELLELDEVLDPLDELLELDEVLDPPDELLEVDEVLDPPDEPLELDEVLDPLAPDEPPELPASVVGSTGCGTSRQAESGAASKSATASVRVQRRIMVLLRRPASCACERAGG
jgi:hypothetical protein